MFALTTPARRVRRESVTGDRSGIDATVALSWVLTWFSRCFADFDDVARVFDFILATDPIYMPVYISVAVPAPIPFAPFHVKDRDRSPWSSSLIRG